MEETWIHSILLEYGIYTGSFIICFISGFVPVVNAEIFLVLISSISTGQKLVPVLLLSSLGQMTAKAIFYYGGKGSLKISHKRYEDSINQTIVKMKKWESKVDIFGSSDILTENGFWPHRVIQLQRTYV